MGPCCRRLSPKQSQESAAALTNIQPDDDFVVEMLQHWWHSASSASTHQPSSLIHQHSQLQVPSNADREGQTQPQQALAPLTAGHPKAAAVDMLTERLKTDAAQGQQRQNDTDLRPQAAGYEANAAGRVEGTLGPAQGRSPGSRHAFDPLASPTDQHEQNANRQQNSVPDRPNHSVQPAVAEAAKAAADVTAEPAVEAAHPGMAVLLPLPCCQYLIVWGMN